MNDRQKKCPGCGLTNFRDAVDCQWCALALRGRARNELVDDAPPPAGKPWGLVLMFFALLLVGGGILWHVSRKAAEREALAAETAEAAEAEESAKARKRTGPPSLSGRGPGDAQRDPLLRSMDEAMEKQQREMQRYMEANDLTPEAQQRQYNEAMRRRLQEQREAAQRRLEERRRADEDEPPPAPDAPDDH